MPIELYFDGFCPESLLKGKQVEMRLNKDDFWESCETGLQIVVSAPYAAILKWRGKGEFKDSTIIASDSIVGMVLTGTSSTEESDILPDESNILESRFDLEWYLAEVYASKEEFEREKFNPNDPAFAKQERHLFSLQEEDYNFIFSLFRDLRFDEIGEIIEDQHFEAFHKSLYDKGVIFSFNWRNWQTGWRDLQSTEFDFSEATLLHLSMYLTAIFREDRFNEGTIALFFNNGAIEEIMMAIQILLKNERHG